MKRILMVLAALCVLPAQAEDVAIPAPLSQHTVRVPDFSRISPVEQASVLKRFTQESLERAILYPSSENTATFLRWQKFWTDRASIFSRSFAVVRLNYPDRGNRLDLPQQAVAPLSGAFGLFYFYHGQDPIDPQMAGVVANFSRTHDIVLNFSDFYSDLMDNQKIPDVDAMTKIARDRIADQVNQQTGGGK